MASLALGTLAVAYHTFFVARRGRTIGKMMTGLTVEGRDTREIPTWDRALIRALVPVVLGNVPNQFLAVALTVGLGVSILIHPERRGWHDRAAGTWVVRDPVGG